MSRSMPLRFLYADRSRPPTRRLRARSARLPYVPFVSTPVPLQERDDGAQPAYSPPMTVSPDALTMSLSIAAASTFVAPEGVEHASGQRLFGCSIIRSLAAEQVATTASAITFSGRCDLARLAGRANASPPVSFSFSIKSPFARSITRAASASPQTRPRAPEHVACPRRSRAAGPAHGTASRGSRRHRPRQREKRAHLVRTR